MIAVTAIGLYLCYLIALPFLSPLVWAMSLAVLCFPFYAKINGFLGRPGIAAGLATFFVAVLVVFPLVYGARELGAELWNNVQYLQSVVSGGEWRSQLEGNRFTSRVLAFVEREINVSSITSQVTEAVPELLSGSAWFLLQLFITFFALFFFFRDHEFFLSGVRKLIPLSTAETDRIFKRVSDTIYATVFGEILISLLQGVMGGLLFWAMGLPAPVLWGFIMALFAFLPGVGAWFVWAPAAAYYFFQGEPVTGIVLLAGGIATFATASVLYPALVGNRLRLHTLIVLVSILGGLIVFGGVGIILGPLVVALTGSVIEIWRDRRKPEVEN